LNKILDVKIICQYTKKEAVLVEKAPDTLIVLFVSGRDKWWRRAGINGEVKGIKNGSQSETHF
jgi:hypothetical protein